MKNRKMNFILAGAAVTAAMIASSACRREAAPSQTIEPVYAFVADCRGNDSLTTRPVPDSLQASLEAFMQVVGFAPVCPRSLQAWAMTPPVEVFTPAVDTVYPSLVPLERQLGYILQQADAQGIELPRREYAAVVWGKMQSIVFADSVMLIALNHYLGEEYDGYSSFPAYQRINKTPENLPYDLAEALVATEFTMEDENPTVLSAMLYEGAMIEAKMRLVPDAELHMALGYREEQLQWLRDHEHELWQTMLSRRLLFEHSATTINQLIGPAPLTRVLSPYAPGRAGCYLGYRMVQSYLRKHRASLPELLSPSFTADPDILSEINYRP